MTDPSHAPLAPDPAVPRRDLLLDGEAMAERLAGRLGSRGPVAIERCEPARAKYQPGRSLRVLYRVGTRRSSELVALRTFAGRRGEAVHRRAAAGAVRSGELRGVAHDPELGAVMFVFPNDRKLAGLPALWAGARETPLRSRLVTYAPEKCATFALVERDGRTAAFAKAYADEDGERTHRIHEAIGEPAAEAGVRLPRATAYLPARRTLVCEAIDGRALAALSGSAFNAGLRLLGTALAGLHGLGPPAAAPAFERIDRERLERAGELIARMRPDCAVAARSLVGRLVERRPPAAERVCLHGDVHAKNAIVAGGRAALVDLDQVAAGPAAADLGSMLAALRYARLVDTISPAEEDAHARALLAGYAIVREPPDPRALGFHLSAALLAERALRAVTRLRAPGLRHLPDLLAEAGAMVPGPGRSGR